MEKNLTPEELKTLKLFAYYCMGYGCNEVNYTVSLYNCEIDWLEKNSYCADDDGYSFAQSIEMYDKIKNLVNEISQEIIYAGAFDDTDCDNSASLIFNFDNKERKLNVKGYYNVIIDKPGGITKEEDDFTLAVTEFMESLKSQNIDFFTVDFSGGGDSGYIDKQGSNGIQITPGVEDYLYQMLSFFGGWEINEGSHGTFHFNVKSGNIELEFYEHSMEDETIGTVFSCEF